MRVGDEYEQVGDSQSYRYVVEAIIGTDQVRLKCVFKHKKDMAFIVNVRDLKDDSKWALVKTQGRWGQ